MEDEGRCIGSELAAEAGGEAFADQQRVDTATVRASIVLQSHIVNAVDQEGIVSGTTLHAIRAGATVEVVIADAAVEGITSLITEQLIVARSTMEQIIPLLAMQLIVSCATVKPVVARAAEELVVAEPAIEQIIPAQAIDDVVASTAVELVVVLGPDDDIVTVAADHEPADRVAVASDGQIVAHEPLARAAEAGKGEVELRCARDRSLTASAGRCLVWNLQGHRESCVPSIPGHMRARGAWLEDTGARIGPASGTLSLDAMRRSIDGRAASGQGIGRHAMRPTARRGNRLRGGRRIGCRVAVRKEHADKGRGQRCTDGQTINGRALACTPRLVPRPTLPSLLAFDLRPTLLFFFDNRPYNDALKRRPNSHRFRLLTPMPCPTQGTERGRSSLRG
jgi:hypothetical protein